MIPNHFSESAFFSVQGGFPGRLQIFFRENPRMIVANEEYISLSIAQYLDFFTMTGKKGNVHFFLKFDKNCILEPEKKVGIVSVTENKTRIDLDLLFWRK